MNKSAILPLRLIVAAILHFPLAYFLYISLYGSRGRHSSFPLGFTLLEFGVATLCIAFLVPALVRGDSVRRLMAVFLLVLPSVVFAIVVKLTIAVISREYA
jgi:hypothetical protein